MNAVRGEHYLTAELAREAGLRLAKRLGWTPPRWWQGCRWRDYPRKKPK